MRRLYLYYVAAVLVGLLANPTYAVNSGTKVRDISGYIGPYRMVSDLDNSALVIWQETAIGTLAKWYAQRIDSTATTQWTAPTLIDVARNSTASLFDVISDHNGGAWCIFESSPRSSCCYYTNYDYMAYHIRSNGTATGYSLTTSGPGEQGSILTGYTADLSGDLLTTSWVNPGSGSQGRAFLRRLGTIEWSVETAGNNQARSATFISGRSSANTRGRIVLDGTGGCFTIGPSSDFSSSYYLQWHDAHGNAHLGYAYNYGLAVSALDAKLLPGGVGRAFLVGITSISQIDTTGAQNFSIYPGSAGSIESFGMGSAGVFARRFGDGLWVAVDSLNQLHDVSLNSSYALRTSTSDGAFFIGPNYSGYFLDTNGATLHSTPLSLWKRSFDYSNSYDVAGIGARVLMCNTDSPANGRTALYVTALTRDGRRVPDTDYESPRITFARDTRNDQGGLINLGWERALYDDPSWSRSNPVIAYRIWRRLDMGNTRGTTAGTESHRGMIRAVTREKSVEYWEAIKDVPSHGLAAYGVVVPTTQDSLPGSNPYTAFFVSAITNLTYPNSVFYDSPVDSGYSVDNLPPRAPLFAGARYEAGQNHLHWLPNTETDLNGYILYRGTHPDFVVDVTDPVAFVADTGYVDAATGPMYYKIAAVDRHGNRSPYITVLPTGNAGVGGGGLSLAFSLARPFPNPSDGSTLNVEFTLPTSAPATLEVLDVSGRCVLRDDLAGYAAGRHTIDIAKRVRLASGLYVIRVTQSGTIRTIRATVLK